MKVRTLIIVLAVIMVTASLQAAAIPGRWEKVDGLEPSFPIVVKLTSGEQYKAHYVRLDADNLIIEEAGGKVIRLRKEHVKQVASQAKIVNDSLWQGAVIGGAIGAVFGIIPAAGIANEGNQERATAAVAITAGIGAGIGLLMDAGTKAPEVYYRAPKN